MTADAAFLEILRQRERRGIRTLLSSPPEVPVGLDLDVEEFLILDRRRPTGGLSAGSPGFSVADILSVADAHGLSGRRRVTFLRNVLALEDEAHAVRREREVGEVSDERQSGGIHG